MSSDPPGSVGTGDPDPRDVFPTSIPTSILATTHGLALLVSSLNLMFPRSFFWEPICLFFIKYVQIFVIFLWYQFLYWCSFLLFVFLCCQLCGNVHSGIYPDFFRFHAVHKPN